MGKKRWTFASDDEIGYLSFWVDEIVSAMCRVTGGRPPIFISDPSVIGDFGMNDEEFILLSDDLGIDVKPEDTFVAIAKRLKKARES